ncbi:unnamed protein product [Arabidopsis thaliana]|uniref:DNA/RNA-binding protein Kin17 WH-like domain-containing protein n=1 Tax=Arabidopsis thaliana TaxID=3702 RepID=A0A654GA20_ARATH|nr:unnamed protein product [Arabidopsis thaliana]
MSSSSIPNGIFIIDGQERYVNPEGDVESNKSERTSKASMVFQMCEKQCRDENGFKCHCMSESHQRQMQVLGQNPTRVVNGYSQEFEQTFLDLMRRSHRFSRVAATVVYNELKNKRVKSGLAEEEKQEREIQKQIERASAGCEGKDVVVDDDDDDDDDEKKKDEDFRLKKVGFALGLGVKERGESSKLVFGDEENDKVERGDKRKRSALDELMKEEEKKKERMNRKDYWLFEGIIVKVELKTVLPQIGGMVKIVNGAYRGSNTRLLDLDTEKFCAKVQIEKGVYDGRVIKSIEYEDICKLA